MNFTWFPLTILLPVCGLLANIYDLLPSPFFWLIPMDFGTILWYFCNTDLTVSSLFGSNAWLCILDISDMLYMISMFLSRKFLLLALWDRAYLLREALLSGDYTSSAYCVVRYHKESLSFRIVVSWMSELWCILAGCRRSSWFNLFLRRAVTRRSLIFMESLIFCRP